ncbi:MAG: adenylate/guanylate cyclase domain-containing protein [Ahrensia sp.]|nr:adenylate/guanylate cyclase domain-containing protein [Ahrensia sp.]
MSGSDYSDVTLRLHSDFVWRSRMEKWLVVLFVTIISGFIGEMYGTLVYGEDAGDHWRGFRTGATIGFISAVIEVFYIRSVRRSWVRRVAFLPGLLVRILALTVIVRVGLKGNEFLSQYLAGQPLGQDLSFRQELRDTLFSMGIVIAFVVGTQLSSIIGWRRFTSLVIGRYFRPSVEDRVFLLVDLVDSTALASRLGNVRFHELLSEFFYQLDRALVSSRGEVVSYIGDAVIFTWPLSDDRRKNARSIHALIQMISHIKDNEAWFEAEFGAAPSFRAVLHGGEVVVGECGDSRRQVTYLGSVLNMIGRLEGLAKNENQPFLITKEIVDRMEPPKGVHFKSFGERQLKGLEKPISVYSINIDGLT